jgi:hypothetical protein
VATQGISPLKIGLLCAGCAAGVYCIVWLNKTRDTLNYSARDLFDFLPSLIASDSHLAHLMKARKEVTLHTLDRVAQRLSITPTTAKTVSCVALVLADPLFEQAKTRILSAIIGNNFIAAIANRFIPTPAVYCAGESLSEYAQNTLVFSSFYQSLMASQSLSLSVAANIISIPLSAVQNRVLSDNAQRLITSSLFSYCLLADRDHAFSDVTSEDLSSHLINRYATQAISDRVVIPLAAQLSDSVVAQLDSALAPQGTLAPATTDTNPADEKTCCVCLDGAPKEQVPAAPAEHHAGPASLPGMLRELRESVLPTIQSQLQHIALPEGTQPSGHQTAESAGGGASTTQDQNTTKLITIPCQNQDPNVIHPACLMAMQNSGRTFKCPMCRAPFATTFTLTREPSTPIAGVASASSSERTQARTVAAALSAAQRSEELD